MNTKLDFKVLNRICDRAFFLALEMIDAANHRPQPDKSEPKVGGHASACASSQHILTAIHLVARNPEDYVACKPHVSPMDHALNFLLQNFREADGRAMSEERRKIAMRNLRHYSREGEPVFQSYHAETDPDSYRFYPSGSVGIPPVNALYTALAYDFVKDHGHDLKEDPFFWCLMGDSEFREGSLAEAMPDAGERQLNQVVWIVDYNRQNLDGTRVTNENALDGTDADRMIRIAVANGWNAINLKHGAKRRKIFKKPGGEEFRRVLDEEFTDFEFQGLLAANDPPLTRKILHKKSSKLKALFKSLSDEEVHHIFINLAGHDLESLVEALQAARKSEKPTLIVAYTIKGRGLKCQAMSGNHSTLPDTEELKEMGERVGLSHEAPFQDFESGSKEEAFLATRRQFLVEGIDKILATVKKRQQDWLTKAQSIDWPTDFQTPALKFNPQAHTQWMWGQIAAKLDRLARGEKSEQSESGWMDVAPYFLTMAPDVGSSTNTSPNMNGKLYGDIGQEDYEALYEAKDAKAPDVIPNLSERTGHLRFEIAEGNCMSAAGSFGKFFHFVGIPLFPAMTIYDFFIKRAHDQYYYNLYWKSDFATIGTPSGVTLAPEGAQHSWKSDFQIPNCVTWEPSFAQELGWIFADLLKRHFTQQNANRQATLIRCVTKGVPQKEFLKRLKRQLKFKSNIGSEKITVDNEAQFPALSDAEILEATRQDVLKGAYALIDYRGYDDYTPGDNVVHLFSMGALVWEAIKASDELLKKGIYANVFVVSSSDLLLGNQGYETEYEHLEKGLGISGNLHLNSANIRNEAQWYALMGNRIPIVSVHDGEPGLLDNIGSIVGVKQEALAVRKTSKSGTTKDVFYFHSIDCDAIVQAAERMLTRVASEQFQIDPGFAHRISDQRG